MERNNIMKLESLSNAALLKVIHDDLLLLQQGIAEPTIENCQSTIDLIEELQWREDRYQ